MARRSGLGKRLDQILRDSQEGRYPAYERLFEKTTPGEPTSAYQEYFDELEEKEARRLADERRREEEIAREEAKEGAEKRLSAKEVLQELGISIQLFKPYDVASSKNPEQGPTSSTRISRYYYSLPGGSEDTAKAIVNTYYGIAATETPTAKKFSETLACNLYVKWQRGKSRLPGTPINTSSYDEVYLKDFEPFTKNTSLGKEVVTFYYLDFDSADPAAAMDFDESDFDESDYV